ncbi:Enamine/imine deaminase [uncultured Desulfobacterium sp.]|uniref:Enamine/imine deaminase n=1 Tax=uncultured Desulfobacterium sp. TaxID=201089 RepID=A0A445MVN0_9BACT|nr:Enamine/imine deaminase [uncultured Desulfobacterium sp.]
MDTITSENAPAAVGPYSQAIRAGDFLFCSGQIGLDPHTKMLAGKDIRAQTVQVFKNIRAVLNAAGLDLKDTVKTTVFLKSMDDFPIVNDIYGREMGGHRPARSTVEVARLPLNALIEIECIAASNIQG